MCSTNSAAILLLALGRFGIHNGKWGLASGAVDHTIEGELHLSKGEVPLFGQRAIDITKYATECTIGNFGLVIRLGVASATKLQSGVEAFPKFSPKMAHKLNIPVQRDGLGDAM